MAYYLLKKALFRTGLIQKYTTTTGEEKQTFMQFAQFYASRVL